MAIFYGYVLFEAVGWVELIRAFTPSSRAMAKLISFRFNKFGGSVLN
jgi:hypothetical protein